MKHLFTITLFVISVGVFAQDTQYFNKKGVAINGYDPVAYFTDNAAVEGATQFSYEWQGTKWLFKSQKNLDSFKATPEKYAPQFGGYCAYGVSENHKSPTEGAAFTIVDDKLYLNYNMQVREMWRKDTQDLIAKGRSNWTVLKNKKD